MLFRPRRDIAAKDDQLEAFPMLHRPHQQAAVGVLGRRCPGQVVIQQARHVTLRLHPAPEARIRARFDHHHGCCSRSQRRQRLGRPGVCTVPVSVSRCLSQKGRTCLLQRGNDLSMRDTSSPTSTMGKSAKSKTSGTRPSGRARPKASSYHPACAPHRLAHPSTCGSSTPITSPASTAEPCLENSAGSASRLGSCGMALG